ncbi:MAG: Coenzyme F420 hydrogenase/dehydrogenase, beta subunit C-terminal domain [Brooklawnia sp.]|uniref:Coenzyme F420 hydrogenase/dehydrogenase, beta subunit C-terminal domain n=1 Tax=Brooklawnia sp. TaxID=2699740 RepID=UPI003C71B172
MLSGGLCLGCGGCALVGADHGVTMVDYPHVGLRPTWSGEVPLAIKDEMIAICPGAAIEAPAAGLPRPTDPDEIVVGPAVQVWEGWATDPQVRRAASSGGAVSALAAYAVEQLGMTLVLHVAMDPVQPWRNRNITSTSLAELLDRAGSRYAPSSPVEALKVIEDSDRPCVFIGKPCDVAAVAKLRRVRPALDRNLGLVLSFFCAGTPNTDATLKLAGSLGFADPDAITNVRYRGDGWPGEFRVRDRSGREESLSYEESWGALAARHRQLRCHLCPDGLGELSDVTGGDAWHRRDQGTDGVSLILARTHLGRRTVEAAIAAGYLTADPSDVHMVVKAQGLVRRRRQVAIRMAALRIFGRPVPRFRGFHLAAATAQLPPTAVVREFAGMIKRIVTRGYWRAEARN